MRIVSKRQREVYNFIVRFIKAKGYSPTIRDIANRFGFSSPASVHKYLVTLEQAGLIVRGQVLFDKIYLNHDNSMNIA